MDKVKPYILVALFLCLAIFVYLPILVNISFPARGDWDLAFFNNAVSFISIQEYHQLPLWNPFYCGGFSYIGSPDSSLFSIQTILSLIIQNVVVATKINVVIHVFFGLWGMWLLGQYLRFEVLSAIIAAIIFVFNGCVTSHIGEGPFDWLSIYFLPWVTLFFLKSNKSMKFTVLTGVMLALMFYDRAGYTFNFTVLFLAVLTGGRCLLERKIEPLIRFIFILLLWAGFSAPKLVPLVATLNQYPRLTNPGQAWDLLKLFGSYILQNSDPYGPARGFKGVLGYWEINAYVGIMPVCLFLSALMLRSYALWSLAAVFLLVVSLGNFSDWAPWTLLHKLPIFNTMQLSPRINLVFLFVLAVLVGGYLSEIEKWGKRNKWIGLVVTLVFIGIFYDLTTYSYRIIGKISRDPYLISAQYLKGKPFEQIKTTIKVEHGYGSWSHMNASIVENKGLINGYLKVPFKRYAKAKDDKDYKGEFYLEGSKGHVELVSWSPNQLTYQYQINQSDRLVVNQNFFKEWRTLSKIKVENFKGLLSVPLEPGDGTVTLVYYSSSFIIGIIVFCIVILLLIIWGVVKSRTYENRKLFT